MTLLSCLAAYLLTGIVTAIAFCRHCQRMARLEAAMRGEGNTDG